jgi:ATP-binding cassette subfamily C (CFTR/MRP) protein 1
MFSQPFLIAKVLKFASEPASLRTNNIAYGLIGATAVVYTGIAVRSQPLRFDIPPRLTFLS